MEYTDFNGYPFLRDPFFETAWEKSKNGQFYRCVRKPNLKITACKSLDDCPTYGHHFG